MNCVESPQRSGNSISALATPEPHYIPGYGGYLPQAKYRPGNTYGMTSHRVLMDPCIHMSPRSMLSNMHPEYCTDDFGRPGLGADPLLAAKMALVNSRVNSFGRQQYQADMTPGYTGYVPRFQTILGHTYSPACNRALAAFEQEQWRDRLFNKELEALDGWRFCYKSKPWESPEVQRANAGDLQEFARSPCCQQPKFLRNDVQCATSAGSCGCGGDPPKKKTASCCSCDKDLTFTILTRERPLCDYGDRRMWGIASENMLNQPVGDIIKKQNSFMVSRPPIERKIHIYRGCEGLPPNYCGHVPGEKFRFGRSYTSSTRNAKWALESTNHTSLCYPPTFKK